MNRRFHRLLPMALAAMCVSPVVAKELHLSIKDGRVTLMAKDVPPSELLAEWARVGQTTIVGGNELVGPAVTLELVDVPEAQALQTLLQLASGYVAVLRRAGVPGASYFDRVVVLATSRAPDNPAPAVSDPAARRFNQPIGRPAAPTSEQSGQTPQLERLVPQPATVPAAPVTIQPKNDSATSQPTSPTGTPRPGMLTETAAQPLIEIVPPPPRKD